ncbi:hypothetical protein ABKA04_003397 [Annulohypoxylon sp. FPYF3050]
MTPPTTFTIIVTILAILFPLGYVLLSSTIGKIRRRNRKPRQDGIKIIADPPDAEFEIVAVHGLAADPDYTWEGVSSENDNSTANDGHPPHRPKRIHLLRNLLINDFKKARIISFAYNSDWLVNAPRKSPPEIGKRLLRQLIEKQRGRKLPIIFIGHSFGGIIIKEALCASSDSGNISDITKGIVFLGTPHQGSSTSYYGAVLASLTRFLGSDSTLLLYLQSHGTYLSDVENNFRAWRNKQRELRIVSFYETMPTYMLKWLYLGMVVDRDSATGSAIEVEYMDTDHSGMNKFAGKEDPQYKKLREKINDLIPLDKPYKYICEKIYTEERLKIERLSSNEPLPMEQCYINLGILSQHGEEDTTNKSSLFSLTMRLKVETPPEEYQVELPTLFSPRKRQDGSTIKPRRILIRGNAGIGKTTLCKKIVYDFTRNSMWEDLFDRVIWIPLRRLKNSTSSKGLYEIFSDIYFGERDGRHHAEVLYDALKDDRYRSKTLFLLDGLDEVSELFKTTLLIELLNKPNVVITTRPHVTLPREIDGVDVEFETIGFYPGQVNEYLEKVVEVPTRVAEIQSFLQQHWLLQSLVRIPVQLDALCLTWSREFDENTILDTMTGVYKAISNELWRKDIERLRADLSVHEILQAHDREIQRDTEYETGLLQHLAFTGICNNVVEFNPRHRNEFIKLIHPKKGLVLDVLLGKLSFFRTSDSSVGISKRSYHFLHLTYQEFFAAQYFAKQFESGEELAYLDFGSDDSEKSIQPTEFLLHNKYNVRYDIVWRFTVGLLKPKEVTKFFSIIMESHLDLLGPTHQQLIAHCLSEKSDSTTFQCRQGLEDKLSRWSIFECDLFETSDLVKEYEFPALFES